MRQVLLFDTAIATTNLGDEIIYESTKEGLKPILDDSLVFRLGTHVENYSIFQMGKKNWKEEVLCNKANLKFICGTNLLSASLKGLYPQWMLKTFNKNLYKDAVTVGVGKTTDFDKVDTYTEKLYKSTLSSRYAHSVRDENTKKVMEDLGFRAINTGCPTLWMMDRRRCEIVPENKSENVIISVSGYETQKSTELDKKWINIVLKHYKKVYVWIQTVVDKDYADTLIGENRYKYICSLSEFDRITREESVDYIGTRLHGGIFALQHGCRTIVISIDQRAEGFNQSNNLPVVKRDEVEDLLEDKIESRWATSITIDRDAINEFLAQFEN